MPPHSTGEQPEATVVGTMFHAVVATMLGCGKRLDEIWTKKTQLMGQWSTHGQTAAPSKVCALRWDNSVLRTRKIYFRLQYSP